MNVSYTHYSGRKYIFCIPTVLKTTRHGMYQDPLQFESYTWNGKLCIVNCVQEDRKYTNLIRDSLTSHSIQLVLSNAYSHHPVGSFAKTRYVRTFLKIAGINVTVFTTH